MPRFIKRSLAEKASGEFKRQQGSPRDRCDGPGLLQLDLSVAPEPYVLGHCAFACCCAYSELLHGEPIQVMGDAERDQSGGAWSRVPVWDGSPQTWRAFQREMKWWTSSLDLEGTKKYNLAARWLLRQSGVVRQRGEEFNPDELEYQKEVKGEDPQTGAEVVITPEDPLSGLTKLLKALEGINGKTTLDKRGELRNLFYLELKRKPGERIAEFCSRFRVSLADLRTEGVTLPSGEVGWFFKTKLGLDPLRVQLLETALSGAEEYETIEREVLRLFKDLHSQDPLVRKSFGDSNNKGGSLMQRFLTSQNPSSKPSSYAPSMASSVPRSHRTSTTSGSSRFSGFRKPFPARQAMVSEAEDPEPDEEAELLEDENEAEPNLEDMLKSEAEALAAELDDAADNGVDASTLQEIEESVETAAEALLTMKEARKKLQEVKRDRGYLKPADGTSKNNPKKTAKNPCFDCGLPGHWAGDPECGKPGQGLARKSSLKKPGSRHVKVVETLNTEHVDEAEGESHEVLTVSAQPLSQSFVAALEDAHSVTKEALIAQLAEDKRLVGALDSACNRTCAGPDWLKGYLHGLQSAPESIRSLVTSKPEHETFRFGNGGTKVSDMRWRLPTVIGGRLFCFWCSVVPVPSLGLLLGRDFLESIGADLSFSRRELCCERLGAEKIQLKQLAAGHYLLPLIPAAWPGVGSQRWRRIGQDGIIELQMSMFLKLNERMLWAARGVLLWLLQRPFLRFLPFPYPSTSSTDKWLEQARKQVSAGVISKRHFKLAVAMKQFTMANLGECIHLRGRIGLKLAFCEDPTVEGMLQALPMKGMANKIRKAVQAEAVAAAKQLASDNKREAEARTLIGPKGGLPSLRGDLVRLAALLQVTLGDKDTIEVIKEKVKPMVAILKEKPVQPTAAKSTAKAKAAKPKSHPKDASASSMSSEVRPLSVLQDQVASLTAQLEAMKALLPEQHQVPVVDLMEVDAKSEVESMTSEDYKQVQEAMLEDCYGEALRAQYGNIDLVDLTQAQMIAQAWQKHEADRLKTSWGPAQIRETLVADYENDFWHALTEETFIQPMVFDFESFAVKPFVTEVYTSAENVMKEARKRGHNVGQSMSLETGWNFLDANDRFKAYNKIRDEKPFCVVLAFPCNGFSPLQRLNGLHPERKAERRAIGRELMKFALEIAELQIREGRHVILENPRGSEAWNEPEMLRFLEENELYAAIFDQCRFGLKSLSGWLHKKPTRVVSSSSDVAAELDGVTCMRNHPHAPVLGGSHVTARAGIYPKPLARAMVRGLEKQFEREFAPREALAAEIGEDVEEEELAFEGGGLVMPQDDGSDVEDEVDSKGTAIPVSSGMRATILRLHQNTGHRSGKRLARALAIAGAPAEAIQAAKQLQCSVCQERQPPRARRPASLPVPRDMGDQIHVDLLEVFDTSEKKYVVAHATDAATRFQMAEILPDKSTKSVVRFLSTRWIATFGPPRVMVVDQGREFVSWEMEEYAGSQSILLHHIAVQDMQVALAEATSAYNGDINELGRTSTIPNPTIEQLPEPGTICYFYRPLKYNNKTAPSKKKLTLKRWHGPALLLAIEGRSSGYLSYKGQLTKCALEHIRAASTMEQIAADSWREAIEEAVEAATLDLSARGLPLADGGDGTAVQQPAAVMPMPGTPAFLPSSSAAAVPEQAMPVGDDLPPVAPQELAGALMPASAPVSTVPSRRLSEATFERATTDGLSSGLGDGLRKRASSFASQLQGVMEQARRQRLADPTGTKRAADTSLERLKAESSEPPVPQPDEPPVITATSSTEPAAEALQTTREDVLSSLGDPSLHPLQHIYNAACEDRLNPTEVRVKDHGSWDGRWPLPSRTEWHAHQRLGLPWPCGHDDLVENDVMAVQANRKEFHWRSMSDAEKAEFKIAAEQAWSVWKENDAVEELSPEESQRVRERLKREGQQGKILTPRYVFTDKHEGLRTEQNKLPLRARARIVVPGFKDIFSFGLRKDAPTCSRLAQHFLLTLTACFNVMAVGADLAWTLLSADIKSAFMKGDAYMDGTRELFMENIRGASDELRLPFPGLARIRKGVFGLSDAPRRWYLRLNKSLIQQGWQRTTLDYACWVPWSPCGTRLDGVLISHVDDLLLGGNRRAVAKLQELGRELGFGSTSEKDITYCGKRIRQWDDGHITITMEEYHSNLKTVNIPVPRRANPDSDLTEMERQLRAILGSLQWLVAQLRFDLGFQLSTLQGEPPKISTLMKANLLVKRFKQDPDFALTFKPMDLKGAGIMVVTDASLGNVTKAGGADGTVLERVFSQSAYYVLLADKDLLAGREGSFSVLDARSHRLPRVCRSTYGAELLGTEEAFDVGCFCRGWWAMLQGLPIEHKRAEEVMDCIPLAVVTDARDVYDKGSSDTPSYGSQKSLAFTVAWIRGVLSKPNTMLKWTSTENLFVDCGTKDMSTEHVHKILSSCRWSVTFNQEFVKQKQKTKPKKLAGGSCESLLVGSALGENSPIYPYLAQLSASPGWHQREGVLINVARHAKSFRTPGARVDPKKFPLRTTYARIDHPDGKSDWRILEEGTEYGILPNPHALLGTIAGILVTVYRSQATNKEESTEETCT
ncbi:unnamed protein product [Cladocopium goreaui]|uniref:Retrovirus-related Pol polyprotein from transposon RE2 (Retro element 2) (AtRE2) n=1 Tax=Cladocopium goreaui TaxID=2562237 RepID=A0A9P1BLV0_9DINO|nr:unnamed protein product [Cladocopium goreaui]